MEQASANFRVATANLQQAKAELVEAQAAYNRNSELVARGFISTSAYDIAEARYQNAQAVVGSYKASIYMAIIAMHRLPIVPPTSGLFELWGFAVQPFC